MHKIRIGKTALGEARQNSSWVVASPLTRQRAYSPQPVTGLPKPRVCLHCLQKGRSSQDLCAFLALLVLYFEGVHRLDKMSRPGSAGWVLLINKLKHTKFHLNRKKALFFLGGLLNTGTGGPGRLWSLCPWSQSKPNWMQCWGTCSSWPSLGRRVDWATWRCCSTPLQFWDWFCEELSDSRQQSWPYSAWRWEKGTGHFDMQLCHFQMHNKHSNTLQKLQSGMLIKYF